MKAEIRESMESLWKICHHLDDNKKKYLFEYPLPSTYKNIMENDNVSNSDIRKIVFTVFNHFYDNPSNIESFYFDVNKITFNAPDWAVKEALRLVCNIIMLLYGNLFFSSKCLDDNNMPLPEIYRRIADRLNYQLWKWRLV